jgi:hypothetical protein
VPAALAGVCALAVVALWFAANDFAAGRELDAAVGDELHTALAGLDVALLKGASSLADTLRSPSARSRSPRSPGCAAGAGWRSPSRSSCSSRTSPRSSRSRCSATRVTST